MQITKITSQAWITADNALVARIAADLGLREPGDAPVPLDTPAEDVTLVNGIGDLAEDA